MRGFAAGGGGPDIHGFWQKNAARAGTRYYGPIGLTGALIGGTGPSFDLLYGVPLLFGRDTTIANGHLSVAGGRAGTHARIGIYSTTNPTGSPSGADTYPDALLVEGAELDTSAAVVVSTAINYTCLAGVLYCAAYIASTNGAGAAPLNNMDDWGSWASLGHTALNTFPAQGWIVAQAYGALPATFPTVGSATGGGVRWPMWYFSF